MQGTRIDGTVLVIEARLSVNLNALTIEQAYATDALLPLVIALASLCPTPSDPLLSV